MRLGRVGLAMVVIVGGRLVMGILPYLILSFVPVIDARLEQAGKPA